MNDLGNKMYFIKILVFYSTIVLCSCGNKGTFTGCPFPISQGVNMDLLKCRLLNKIPKAPICNYLDDRSDRVSATMKVILDSNPKFSKYCSIVTKRSMELFCSVSFFGTTVKSVVKTEELDQYPIDINIMGEYYNLNNHKWSSYDDLYDFCSWPTDQYVKGDYLTVDNTVCKFNSHGKLIFPFTPNDCSTNSSTCIISSSSWVKLSIDPQLTEIPGSNICAGDVVYQEIGYLYTNKDTTGSQLYKFHDVTGHRSLSIPIQHMTDYFNLCKRHGIWIERSFGGILIELTGSQKVEPKIFNTGGLPGGQAIRDINNAMLITKLWENVNDRSNQESRELCRHESQNYNLGIRLIESGFDYIGLPLLTKINTGLLKMINNQVYHCTVKHDGKNCIDNSIKVSDNQIKIIEKNNIKLCLNLRTYYVINCDTLDNENNSTELVINVLNDRLLYKIINSTLIFKTELNNGQGFGLNIDSLSLMPQDGFSLTTLEGFKSGYVLNGKDLISSNSFQGVFGSIWSSITSDLSWIYWVLLFLIVLLFINLLSSMCIKILKGFKKLQEIKRVDNRVELDDVESKSLFTRGAFSLI